LGIKLAALLVVAMQVVAPQACSTEETDPPAPGEVFVAEDGTRFSVETVATGLHIPWSLVFAPDGRLFVTERPGRVRILQNGRLLEEPAITLPDIAAIGEGGLLGMALHPSFAQNHLVYLAYTGQAPGRGIGIANRLVRFREVANTLGEPAVLIDDITASSIHNGSRVNFGPDGRLYMTTGDAANASLAQDLARLSGKILRINEDGTTPADNPFGSPVYSFGHRNPQGLDWHPATGDLWATEHGATGNDEVNRIVAGRNYGWPVIEGDATRPDMETPILFFSPSIAPSGATFYTGAAFPTFRNNFFFATLAGAHLHRVRFDPADQRRVLGHERLLQGRFGRIRDVVTGPDGAVYFCTSNNDGSGGLVPEDDRILRLVPAR
jgi:glucose/arabinose dehydrogenase